MSKPNDSPRVFIVAGEASGDTIAASVVEALKTCRPGVQILGAGGNKLRVAGQNQCLDLVSHAIMGAAEVLLKLPKYFGFFKKILTEIERTRPDALLLVDYPGLNLRLAKAVRQKFPSIKIIYLVAPKAWAWKAGRAKILEKNADLLIPVFSFEADWYRRQCPRLKVEYAGHPMMDELLNIETPAHRNPRTLALFPGSRKREIQHILPPLLAATSKIKERSIINKVYIAVPHEKAASQARAILSKNRTSDSPGEYEVVEGMSREIAAQSCVGIVKSGTITAECAVLGLPMVVVYKAGIIEAILMWIFVKVKFFSLVNLIAGREIVRELAQFHANPTQIAQETLKLLNNQKARNKMQKELGEVRILMGESGASARVAELISQQIKKEELALF